MTADMSISKFTANFKGGARPNKFKVLLNFPTSVASSAGLDTQQASLMCKASSLPEATIGVAEVFYLGRAIPVPGEKTFPEWTVTVINDEDFKLRHAFEKWSNDMLSHEFNRRVGGVDYKSYTADLEIAQLGVNGDVLRSYKMKNAFPVSVAAIDLAWENNDAIEEFTVSFRFTHWIPNGDATFNKKTSDIVSI